MGGGSRTLLTVVEVIVGVTEKTELASAELQPIWTEQKLGWICDDVDDDTDEKEEEGLQVAGGGAATLTKPVNRLRRGSGHKVLLLDADGSKVKRPL